MRIKECKTSNATIMLLFIDVVRIRREIIYLKYCFGKVETFFTKRTWLNFIVLARENST